MRESTLKHVAPTGPCPVAVIGAGAMGAGIAEIAAAAGHPVRIVDTVAEAAVRAAEGIGRRQEQAPVAVRQLSDLAGVGVGLVVEAIAESLPAKRELLQQLEGVVGRECVLASNTSSLSITALAAGLRAPHRVVGMHFFNPVRVMALVEVVSGAGTAPAVADRVAELATDWGKTPIRVANAPGFVVNRVARPFYGEALRVLAEGGATPATLDAVLREAGGFRMGPLELTDLIGQDVNAAANRQLWSAFGHDPRYAPSVVQHSLIEAGRLGRKSGAGFYDYHGAADRPPPGTVTPGRVPDAVHVEGDWGHWEPLWARLSAAGVVVSRSAATCAEPSARIGRLRMVPTDGRTATARAATGDGPVVVLDLARDPATASRFAVSRSLGSPREDLMPIAAMFRAAGAATSELADVPGLIVGRTVAMLINEAADAVAAGVAAPQGVETAMRLGAGYRTGPFSWCELLGTGWVVTMLDHLAQTYLDGRHRACPALRQLAAAGWSPADPASWSRLNERAS